jgi:hypothetical protein
MKRLLLLFVILFALPVRGCGHPIPLVGDGIVRERPVEQEVYSVG